MPKNRFFKRENVRTQTKASKYSSTRRKNSSGIKSVTGVNSTRRSARDRGSEAVVVSPPTRDAGSPLSRNRAASQGGQNNIKSLSNGKVANGSRKSGRTRPSTKRTSTASGVRRATRGRGSSGTGGGGSY